MRINKPLSDEQLRQGDLIPPGTYDFQVTNAEEKTSKSGNEMIALQLKVWMVDGRERVLFDYLLEALEFKTGHFAQACGLGDKYREGNITAQDCIGKTGQLKVTIQKDKNGVYQDRAGVADYIPTDEEQEKKRKADATGIEPGFNDDLPF